MRRMKFSVVVRDKWIPPIPAIPRVNKKKTYLVDFYVTAAQRVKIKQSKKINKYLVLARQQKKKLWNMRVTVISSVFGALGTVPNDLEKRLGGEQEMRGRIEIILTTALLKVHEDLRRFVVTQIFVKIYQLEPT